MIRFLKRIVGKLMYSLLSNLQSDIVALEESNARILLEQYSPKPKGTCISDSRKIKKIYDLQIVVPCYNVEKYIKQCIDSILCQKTQFSFIVKIINDGSTDRTLDILEQYKSFSNVEIISQQNGGLSAARNRGIQEVLADYIMFVDSDDYLCDGAVEMLLNNAKNSGCKVVEGGVYNLYGSRKVKDVRHHRCEINAVLLKGFSCFKIYSADLFDGICFPAGFLFEDTINKFLIYPKVGNALLIKTMVYVYRQVLTSITHESAKQRRVVESYWVTERCLQDAKMLSYCFNDKYLNIFLEQVHLNQLRVNKCPIEIRKAIFTMENSLLSMFDSNLAVDRKYKELMKTLKSMDFGKFEFWCMTHR